MWSLPPVLALLDHTRTVELARQWGSVVLLPENGNQSAHPPALLQLERLGAVGAVGAAACHTRKPTTADHARPVRVHVKPVTVGTPAPGPARKSR